MAIALEFIDFIVPIALIRQKYPGGWEQCLRDHEVPIEFRLPTGRFHAASAC